jgi:hypothetical protein
MNLASIDAEIKGHVLLFFPAILFTEFLEFTEFIRLQATFISEIYSHACNKI